MFETSTTKAFYSLQKIFLCLTLGDLSYLKALEFSVLKLSGSREKGRLIKTMLFYSKTFR